MHRENLNGKIKEISLQKSEIVTVHKKGIRLVSLAGRKIVFLHATIYTGRMSYRLFIRWDNIVATSVLLPARNKISFLLFYFWVVN